MNTYAFVDNDGYITSIVSSSIEQDGGIIIDFDIGIPPGDGYKYNLSTKQWIDTRTDQQKYDEADWAAKDQRNKLLYASDWTQIPNNPLTTKQQQDWASYRQSLRDITTQSGYPFTIVWPTPPLQ